MNNEKIGFIGVGKMGEALLRGVISSGLISPSCIFANDIDREKLRNLSSELGITELETNSELVKKSEIILLAVKPDTIGKVLSEVSSAVAPSRWCISIAAGISSTIIESYLSAGTPVVRVMPSITAMVREGMAAITPGTYAGERHINITSQIFQAVGKAIVIQEKLMDAVTAVSGSGPAFVFLMIESLADAAVQLGLNRADAVIMAAQTFLGASKMVIDTSEHPAVLKNNVTSPGGTTAAGLYELERNRIRSAIIDAVLAAELRSKQMASEQIKLSSFEKA